MNRLQNEKSPYLQMHASNPVDWYPWCAEAFAQARQADKPIFLSIGYSSCHWCHVIARESFEDVGIAEMLNAGYIAIKVDKEERPDVDAVYMDAVELATGAGGWPMTLLLTPEGQPFFAATYLPKAALARVLRQAAGLWERARTPLLDYARELTGHMRAAADSIPPSRTPDRAVLERAVEMYAASYDNQWGGFGRAPKFPAAHSLLFLLKHSERTGDSRTLEMAERTLERMYQGGLFDHVGGGFCRYSVDEKWLIPHFEKMLYDNALLLWAYAEAWKITRKPLYAFVARRTADYVLRELTGPEGQFYCAQDADSEGKEGAYYLLTRQELLALLGEQEGGEFCAWYGVTPEGNFEGGSVLNRVGKQPDMDGEQRMASARERVYRYRRERMPLGRDDKVLTAWNGLMITALCAAAGALEAPEYEKAARRAEMFLHTHLMRERGALWLRWRGGEAKGSGVLTDYACYVLALTALSALTGEEAYRKRAEAVASAMRNGFEDGEAGGFFLYAKDGEQLITRPKETWDGAVPSGNSCAAMALLQLAEQTGDVSWRQAAEKQLRFAASMAAEHPTAHGFALLALEIRASKKDF